MTQVEMTIPTLQPCTSTALKAFIRIKMPKNDSRGFPQVSLCRRFFPKEQEGFFRVKNQFYQEPFILLL